MKFKDKFIFASVASGLFCIWCVLLFILITTPGLLKTVLGVGAVLFFIACLACLRAVGELGLWECEATRKGAEAKFKYGHLFRGWWF